MQRGRPFPGDLAPCIGVFDSGVGGLSVLRALKLRMPTARLLYLADSGHAPYGERDASFIVERSRRILEHLTHNGARMIVIACNTATAAAAETLRRERPQMPIVGVEPGIRPALKTTRNGHIGVMATRNTIGSARLKRMIEEDARGAVLHLQACDGLALAIERGHADEVRSLIQRHTAPLLRAGVDTVVLGCTHYPLVASAIQSALGADVRLIDTSDAVARRAEDVGHQIQPGDMEVDQRPDLLWTTGADVQALTGTADLWLGGKWKARPASATLDRIADVRTIVERDIA